MQSPSLLSTEGSSLNEMCSSFVSAQCEVPLICVRFAFELFVFTFQSFFNKENFDVKPLAVRKLIWSPLNLWIWHWHSMNSTEFQSTGDKIPKNLTKDFFNIDRWESQQLWTSGNVRTTKCVHRATFMQHTTWVVSVQHAVDAVSIANESKL